ncbi:peptidase S9 [Neokomagataea tanensis NBRC 106556]|uniref:Peptidase S9 n=2 Tax=Acetobacteraceae TaxID=433 RepID=A0ABQ0QH10_9PROT|nr:peptidase S9 [Neokomagataea tanensis NBRC 106556]
MDLHHQKSSGTSKAGFWPSWVSPALVAGKTRGFNELRTAGHWVAWLETRPEEAGRSVVTAYSPGGGIVDLSARDVSVGSSVHEYGGGAWDMRLGADGGPELVLSDRKTGAVWFDEKQACFNPLHRYADLTWAPNGQGVFAVREVLQDNAEPVAALVYVSQLGVETLLVEGADFYAAPRPSPDGKWLAWFTWQHPNMPWTQTALYIAEMLYDADGQPYCGEIQNISGSTPCSIIEPRWSSDGALYATEDSSGLWTPVRFQWVSEQWVRVALPSCGMEIGLPHWVFGQRSIAPLSANRVMALAVRNGFNHVQVFQNGAWSSAAFGVPVHVPEILADGRFAWIDAPPNKPQRIMIGDDNGHHTIIRQSVELPDTVTDADIAVPLSMTYETTGGACAHALYYAPSSHKNTLSEGELPPLVVMAHGGPTGRANTGFAFKTQFWTSRGFSVLDVNYRGSTGYGRSYRDALNGQWGVLDIDDVLAAVQAVVDHGQADPERCVIRGSSAGGLTVLGALARSKRFVAGTVLYGVTDLRGLVEETHKFEARYLDGLIGPYPDAEDVYLQRSPLTFAQDITAPVLFLHGDADKVVALSQAEDMVACLEKAELHIYAGEKHGFRQQETVMDAFSRELAFYQAVFAAQ